MANLLFYSAIQSLLILFLYRYAGDERSRSHESPYREIQRLYLGVQGAHYCGNRI